MVFLQNSQLCFCKTPTGVTRQPPLVFHWNSVVERFLWKEI